MRLRAETIRGAATGGGGSAGSADNVCKIGVVAARFNSLVTKLLVDGALEAIERHGAEATDMVWVPGAFEIPVTAAHMAKSGKYDTLLCIGCVVRGDTTHYDAVAGSAAAGVARVAEATGVPCIFGVLTCETMEQALDRAGGKAGNKGEEAAVTAVEMANLIRELKKRGAAVDPW